MIQIILFRVVLLVEPLPVWQLTEDEIVVTACVEIESDASTEQIRHSVRHYLEHHYQVRRITIEVVS